MFVFEWSRPVWHPAGTRDTLSLESESSVDVPRSFRIHEKSDEARIPSYKITIELSVHLSKRQAVVALVVWPGGVDTEGGEDGLI